MTLGSKPFHALLRLEIADALRSRWVTFTATAYVLVFGAFLWLGLRESSILGFTGLSRVVLNVSNAVVLVLPLVALVSTGQSVVRSRTTGFFELVLTQPCKRTDWLAAAVVARLLVIVGPLFVLLLGVLVAGAIGGEEPMLALVARTMLVAFALSFAYVGLGFYLSSIARTPERATVYVLLAWLLGSALHDFALIGVLLKFRLSPQVVFGLAALNPVESARLAILSGVDPELSVLGPVGFWLANTMGPKAALGVGVGWPLALGCLALLGATRRLEKDDLVG